MAGVARQVFTRAQGESDEAFYRRMSDAASFLYACDPAAPAGAYDTHVETAFLTQGVVVQSRTSGHYAMVRDAERAETRGGDLIMISFSQAGRFGLAASDCGAVRPVEAGSVIVLDLCRTFRLEVADHRHTVFLVSRATLSDDWQDRALHGLILPSRHPLSSTLGAMARGLAKVCQSGEPAHADALLRATLGLLGSTLGEISGAGFDPITIGARLDGLIEAELGDPDLSAATLARQLGVSRATLYRLTQPLGGVTRHLRALRLQRAWLLLTAEPGRDRREVATACGFVDAKALQRNFRQLFGAPLDAALRLGPGERRALDERISEHLVSGWARRTGHVSAVEAAPGRSAAG